MPKLKLTKTNTGYVEVIYCIFLFHGMYIHVFSHTFLCFTFLFCLSFLFSLSLFCFHYHFFFIVFFLSLVFLSLFSFYFFIVLFLLLVLFFFFSLFFQSSIEIFKHFHIHRNNTYLITIRAVCSYQGWFRKK